ncbi:MAG: hypothetical protein JNL83_33915 [Myxococcales bacterium]|nr:hypothetical protein [Myxococcales bacterium]
MSAVDLPPGIGLAGTPLGTFHAPLAARRRALIALGLVCVFMVITWYFVSRHPYRWHSSTQVVLPFAFALFTGLALAVRSARVAVTRDGIRWGWTSLGFTQSAARIACAHVFTDGVALEAHKGSRWFLSARDWDGFDQLVRQLKRAELPTKDHGGKAPIRQRLQSYGRFLDGLVIASVLGALSVALWAA